MNGLRSLIKKNFKFMQVGSNKKLFSWAEKVKLRVNPDKIIGKALNDHLNDKVYYQKNATELLELTNFKIISDSSSSSKMEIQKKIKDWTIHIIFYSVRHEYCELDKSKLDGDNLNTPIQLFILLTREGKPDGFVFQAEIEESELSLVYLVCSKNPVESFKNLISLRPKINEKFLFSFFDEELRDRYYQFLSELGLDQNTVDLIEYMVYEREKHLIQQWTRSFCL